MVWCLAFSMGSPVSGRVVYFCAIDRNEGFFRPSILRCFAMRSPYGSRVVRSKQSFLWITGRYSFRMGSPFSGQTNVLISIEGISTVGLLGVFFQLFLGLVFCHPGFVRLALKSGGGGGGEFPHSAVFTSGADSVCIPLANEGVGLGPSPAGPVASRPPLAGRSASANWRCFFH